jgi:hypothetical protein
VLAVPAGAGLGAAAIHVPQPGRYAAAAVAALLLVAAFVQEERRLSRQDEEASGVLWAAEQVRIRTEPDERVGTDLPIVAYLADRRIRGQLVDSSYVRLGTGSLTDGEILTMLQQDAVRAVVVGREYANRPALIKALRERYPKRIEREGVTIVLAP